MNQAAQAAPPQEPETKTQQQSALLSKNVRIHQRRTSVRLEPEMWNALNEIAEIEKCSIHDLCGAIHDLKEAGKSFIGMSFTGALRAFLVEYYRTFSKSSQQVSLVQQMIKEPQQERATD